ncbi:MAG TPA: hypothetical protein VHY08_27755 [Bacillota bacterium]|nr:hypothetical protein [Bacillota bacterium]
MENVYLMPVYRSEPYCPVINVETKRNGCNNIRFSLNLLNPQMQRMTHQLGFNDFTEMVEDFYVKTSLSRRDIQGNLELLCDILYGRM